MCTKRIPAVKSWQPRRQLRSERGNGRAEPGEEVGTKQRGHHSPVASPVYVTFTNFELLVFCAKITRTEKYVPYKFLSDTDYVGMPMYRII